MRYKISTLLPIFCAVVFLPGSHAAEAGNPIGDFFKKVGNSITRPQHAKNSRRPAKAGETSAPSAKRPPGSTTVVAANNANAVTGIAVAVLTPTPGPMIRTALRPPPDNTRRDLPYGVPVPNKPGLVTSPYSPTRGFVDVRGFPSGTEVKDPYTDKVFLAP